MSYCDFCKKLSNDNVHKIYHDNHYGFPVENDNELFGRLILEINQAGLSWDIILKKEAHFRAAFADFDIQKVASFDEEKVKKLLQNSGIVRNQLKIRAVIHNANVIIGLQNKYGSFKNWIQSHHPKTKEEWVKIFKKTFKFTGGEIVNEFLMSIGYLPGAHDIDCEIYLKIKEI